jgi:mRNA interferase MazF
MTGFERWDVVTALFPFTDAAVRKPRPVLVISHGDFNRVHEHVVGCMITTGTGSFWPTDHRILDLAAAGLARASVVRWKVFTLPTALIGRRIGCLGAPDRSGVAAIMDSVLGAR